LDVTPEFGLWFSGFFDGEGSFAFSVAVNGHKRPAPKIQLTVRQDDAKTIEYIREQVRCGRAYFSCKYRSDKYKNHRPWATFRVSCIADLAEIIVPLFESYPLHTKKAKEFAAWKVVVQKRYRMKNKRYSEVELSRHTELCAEISELRNWSEMPIPVPLASSPGLLPA